MYNLRLAGCALAVAFISGCATDKDSAEPRLQYPGTAVKDTTECRAGCQGNSTGCQESMKTAVLVAAKDMRLHRGSLVMSKSWPGSDTTGLAREPQWEITSYPAGDLRPLSISIKPILSTCEATSQGIHKQARTHYEFTVVQSAP